MDGSGFRILVNRVGAELTSLQATDPAGKLQGFLYRDGDTGPSPGGWGNHATLMGYFLHRLVGERSLYCGKPITGGTHGFLRHFHFDAPELRENGLVYRVDPARIPPESYPLRVSLELSYSLDASGLRVSFHFQNHEPQLTAHLSFGMHPGFAVETPRTCRLWLPPGRYVRHLAPGNFLNGQTEVLEFAGGDFPFDRAALADSYILGLEGVPDRVFRIEDAGRVSTLDYNGVPYVTFWSDGGHFVCVEPCWGLPDSFPQTPFQDKPGIQKIAPGGSLVASFAIHPTFTPQ